MTIPELQYLRESEDKVEFKEAKNNFPYNGGSHKEQENRRKCYLGYIVALANEGGGKLIFGMDDSYPHNVVGSNFVEGKLGELEDGVYEKLEIRVRIEELFDENGLRLLVSNIPSRPVGKMLKFEGSHSSLFPLSSNNETEKALDFPFSSCTVTISPIVLISTLPLDQPPSCLLTFAKTF